MNNKNIILNMSIEQYNKKYRNRRHRLLKLSKEQAEESNKKLINRKWALIDDTYYEIPKPIRLTWFRNLRASTQIATCVLLTGGITSAIVFPVLAMNKKTQNIIVSDEVNKYTQINIGTFEVGKPLQTEFVLKEDAKENKQLPKKLKKVRTGSVVLDEYNSPKNNNEPENFYTYTYLNREKASLYIKKILGPVTIEMDVDDRTYDVTFNPNNEIDETSTIEVKKNNKLSSEQIRKIEDTDYRKFKGWYLKENNDKFNFNSTPITNDITLNARYEKSRKKLCLY